MYGFFSDTAAQGAELKALWQLIKQGSLVVYRWPYTVPKRKTRPMHGTWTGNGNYTPPAQLTLAQLDELAKTAEELDEIQGITPVEEAAEEPTHQVELSYTQADGSPLADKPYTVKVDGNVVATGTLDASGKATVTGLPEGTAEVEYLDDVDADIAATRAELKAELDAILAAHIAESAQENADWAEMNAAEIAQDVIDSGAKLVANAASAVKDTAVDAFSAVLPTKLAITLQATNNWLSSDDSISLEAGRAAFKAEIENYIATQAELQTSENIYYLGLQLDRQEHQDSFFEARELAIFIANDNESQAMVLEFAANYVANNSTKDWVFVGVAVVLEAILMMLTGGATTAKAVAKLSQLTDLLTKKHTNTTVSGPL